MKERSGFNGSSAGNRQPPFHSAYRGGTISASHTGLTLSRANQSFKSQHRPDPDTSTDHHTRFSSQTSTHPVQTSFGPAEPVPTRKLGDLSL